MARKNRNPHPQRRTPLTDRYDVDYIFLPDAPEIAAVVVPQMKTIFRNMSCAPWADEMHVVKNDTDKYLTMIRRMF
jgi:hypothetical protein